MGYRVVFVPVESNSDPVPQAAEELGRRSDGARWVCLRDEELKALYAAGHKPPIIYLSADDYHEAMRELPPDEVEKAILERVKRWSPRAMQEADSHKQRCDHAVLKLAALARRLAPAARAASFDEYLDRALSRRADHSPSTPRGDKLDTILTRLKEMQETDEQALIEVASMSARVPAAKRLLDATATMRALQFTRAALTQIGHPEAAHTRPAYFRPSNWYFVSPAWDGLRSDRERLTLFVGDSAITQIFDNSPELESTPQRSVTLIDITGDFVADLVYATEAQRQRPVTQRLAAIKSAYTGVVLERWADLRIYAAIGRRNLLKVARNSGSPFASELAEHVREETANVADLLAQVHLQEVRAPATFDEARAALHEASRLLANEASFWAWVTSVQDPEVASSATSDARDLHDELRSVLLL